MTNEVSVFWFRRDLRLEDNTGLLSAMKSGYPVLPIFIFDPNILSDLECKKDARVHFIHEQLSNINNSLAEYGSSVMVHLGKPIDIWKSILSDYIVKGVYYNRDYEPYAKQRDNAIQELMRANSIPVFNYKDQVIFESHEVLKANGEPYIVYTPYKHTWLAKWNSFLHSEFRTMEADSQFEIVNSRFLQTGKLTILSLQELGFEKCDLEFPTKDISTGKLDHYIQSRNDLAQDATTKLGVHLRFGTISIRQLVNFAQNCYEVLLSQLIWREFYSQILDHFPKVVSNSFKPLYDNIQWKNDEEEFDKWCKGITGYPLVDAGMRELNCSGFMHNRARMVAASFLCKHLLVDWRWGEAYFAEKLLDYELSNNNGGWQWCAGTGTDASPFFRIFNPITQQQKFDAGLEYVRKWIPEFGTPDYPFPIVDHKQAKARCLEVYQAAIKN